MSSPASTPDAKAMQFVTMVARLTHRFDPEALGVVDESDSDTLDSLIYQAREIVEKAA